MPVGGEELLGAVSRDCSGKGFDEVAQGSQRLRAGKVEAPAGNGNPAQGRCKAQATRCPAGVSVSGGTGSLPSTARRRWTKSQTTRSTVRGVSSQGPTGGSSRMKCTARETTHSRRITTPAWELSETSGY